MTSSSHHPQWEARSTHDRPNFPAETISFFLMLSLPTDVTNTGSFVELTRIALFGQNISYGRGLKEVTGSYLH